MDGYGDHILYVRSNDDPSTFTFTYILKCKRCRWYSYITLRASHMTLGISEVLEKAQKDLLKKFKEDVPASCEEAQSLNVIEEIMNA
jgi:hypothetical protein